MRLSLQEPYALSVLKFVRLVTTIGYRHAGAMPLTFSKNTFAASNTPAIASLKGDAVISILSSHLRGVTLEPLPRQLLCPAKIGGSQPRSGWPLHALISRNHLTGSLYFGIHVKGFCSTLPSGSHLLQSYFCDVEAMPSIRLSDMD